MSKTYRAPEGQSPLITTIVSGLKTPLLETKFSNVITPYYYPNSPRIPRYSITGVFDREKEKEFLEVIQSIERKEKVDSILKCETLKEDGKSVTTTKILVKFQGKDPIPVFQIKEGKKNENNKNTKEDFELLTLEDELARGEIIQVEFDVLRYTKRHTMEEIKHALSFKPVNIFLFR